MVETPETSPQATPEELAALRKQRWIVVAAFVAVLTLLAILIAAVIGLFQNADTTANIRDIFIIFMALESLIIGAALVVLIVQIASLINLLRNEVQPILEATNETVNTLRGTTEFLSENVVEPVIKLNSSIAGLRKFFDIFGFRKQ
jgi:hypothetical protein